MEEYNLTQLSLFADGDYEINESGKKIGKTMRDRALSLQKHPNIVRTHNCVYNLSKNDVECQIEQINKKTGRQIQPDTQNCCTKKCLYYTKTDDLQGK